MKSYKKQGASMSTMKRNTSVEGETIEQKMERIIHNKEPIKDGAPLLFTERKEGVRASTNIRTDRFEVAIDGMDKVAKSYQAKREERQKKKEERAEGSQEPGGQSTQGTEKGPEKP